MARIDINKLTFYYEDFYHPVFEDVTLNLDSDWRLGLIGRNGKGKSTLLKLIAKEVEPSKGTIKTTGNIAIFPYEYNMEFENTLDVMKECYGGLATLEKRLAKLQEQMDQMQNDTVIEEFCTLQQEYTDKNGYEIESKINQELDIIGLPQTLLSRDFQTLSGGEKTCMLIIALFLRKDPFILLDEPTNHLDIEKKDLLIQYLQKKKGFIVVSHDYDFIDQVIDHILAINKADITLEKGNFTTWKENMDRKEEYELQMRMKLVKEISGLEKRAETARNWSDVGNTQKLPFASHERTNGTRAYMRQAKRSEQRIQQDIETKKTLLRNLEEEKPLQIVQDVLEDHCLVELRDLNYSYLKDNALLQHVSTTIYKGDHVWIRGKNGAGKSTLLKIILGEINADSVICAEDLHIAYASQDPKWQAGYLLDRMHEEIKQEEKEQEMESKFRQICQLFDLPEDCFKRPLETLSSGELKKIDIARAISMEHELLILDEPLNYMDQLFKNQLATTLLSDDITVIFVEHNQEFGRKIANKMIYL